MKKFISLLLAAMMLLSCTTAMAENATLTVDTATTSHYATDNAAEGAKGSAAPSVNTEIWLQVDAAGQIDVTVPLVLVFKTNIDGGEATSPSEYKMINNSTADIAVTSIKVTTEETIAASQPMEFVAYDEVEGTDKYGLMLSVEAKKEDATNHRKAHDKYDKDMYGFVEDADTADVEAGGLFQVYKDESTQITAKMKTSALSFTTIRKADDVEGESVLDESKGVKIITITYTVGIDAQNAIGGAITTADEEFKQETTTTSGT